MGFEWLFLDQIKIMRQLLSTFKNLLQRVWSGIVSIMRPIVKSCFVVLLAMLLVLSQADGALAAQSGGRIGGGSFRMPSRSYSAPRSYRSAPRAYSSPARGYYPGGGGFGFPFLIPFVGFGGGGLFTLLIFLAIAGFFVRTFQRFQDEGAEGISYGSPKLSVAQLQVGLLASARDLQRDLDTIAQKADTGSAQGRAQVLQEATLALLRHPEYWVYGAADSQRSQLEAAETLFNRLSLAERSKFTAETLSNVDNQLKQRTGAVPFPKGEALPTQTDAEVLTAGTGEYIVVTLLVGTQSELSLPAIREADDLRQALRQIGSIASDRLLAMEVLWTPQAEGDTLSAEELLTEYVDLRQI